MEAIQERIKKAREERMAREKARIEKLRELNLKKYNNPSNAVANVSTLKVTKKDDLPKNSVESSNKKTAVTTAVKLSVTDQKARSSNLSISRCKNIGPAKCVSAKVDTWMNLKKQVNSTVGSPKKVSNSASQLPVRKPNDKGCKAAGQKAVNSLSVPNVSMQTSTQRKSILPKPTQSNNRESVFQRLYKPKVSSTIVSNVQKMQTQQSCGNKKNATVSTRKHSTTFNQKSNPNNVRRSISAIHFKKISKNELNNCMHKWSSIGDKLNDLPLHEIDEDANIAEHKIVSAVKSERKKVKFMTPMQKNYNTPCPKDLQAKLITWLKKRGKCLDSYHHLQCFGINHMPESFKPLDLDTASKIEFSDDENKENIALESDSDDGSYADNMNEASEVKDLGTWRKASVVSESFEFSDTLNTTLTSADTQNNTDDILLGALSDLTELLKEGFEWEQCARWLRAIREQFPTASNTAQYWECRAALEERRGDLTASVHCWEEAIVKGTERSIVEASLDQLLDKFMQLKISPNSGKSRQPDPKMVDIKNVFKSTLIRFAVQQAKLRQSKQDTTKYTVTPVRRSGRLSCLPKRTPLQDCATLQQVQESFGEKLLFVPNVELRNTP